MLLLTQVLPHPPDNRRKIKTYNVIKHLTQKHRVILGTFMLVRTTAIDEAGLMDESYSCIPKK